jgi:hypothetical protein
MNPAVNFSYHPDFSDAQWGTFKTVLVDAEGNTQVYSIF